MTMGVRSDELQEPNEARHNVKWIRIMQSNLKVDEDASLGEH